MRSHIRLFLAMVLFAGATCAVAQDVNPTPPPPVPPQEATPPPLPDTQSMVPPPVPTVVPMDLSTATPAPVLAPMKPLDVDTSVVKGKVPKKKVPAVTAAKKRSDKSDKEESKALEAAAAASSGDATAAPPPPPAGAGTTATSPAAENPAPPPAVEAAQVDANAAKAEAPASRMKGGSLWVLFAIFVVAAIGMATFVARRSAGGVKELSILPGNLTQPRSPLVSGRHL